MGCKLFPKLLFHSGKPFLFFKSTPSVAQLIIKKQRALWHLLFFFLPSKKIYTRKSAQSCICVYSKYIHTTKHMQQTNKLYIKCTIFFLNKILMRSDFYSSLKSKQDYIFNWPSVTAALYFFSSLLLKALYNVCGDFEFIILCYFPLFRGIWSLKCDLVKRMAKSWVQQE